MMHFFRRNQRLFLIIMSAIIIVSFSFFGTYNALSSPEVEDPVAFKSINGRRIYQSELSAMTRFISTDIEDKRIFGGIWGPNFLNDGVVKRDFLETGIANILAAPFFPELAIDLDPRLEREGHYQPYAHPSMPFLSAEAIWNLYAPGIKKDLSIIRTSKGVLDQKSFSAQVGLYLAERKFPPAYLKEALTYYQQQYSWIPADPNLAHRDLSLFGYHTLEEWFGVRFLNLISQTIINSAELAEKSGFSVSYDEALADLIYRSQQSFLEQQQLKTPYLSVRTPREYFQEQLRILGMDQPTAVALWRQVLLYRRLVDGVGNSVLVDSLLSEKFHAFASEVAKIDLYQLPIPLRLSHADQLERFESYLKSVAQDKHGLLDLPKEYKPLESIEAETPELLEKSYKVKVAEVSSEEIGLKNITLKETWDWELDSPHWQQLIAQFPVLALNQADSKEERLSLLNTLDPNTRASIDQFARQEMIKEHPQWIEEALAQKTLKEMFLSFRLKDPQSPLKGVKDVGTFHSLLETSSLEEKKEPTKETLVAREQLNQWSPDGTIFYKIVAVQRLPQLRVLTFEEAAQDKLLDPLLDKELLAYYTAKKVEDPEAWQEPFSDVKERVKESYFKPLYQAIQEEAALHNSNWNPEGHKSLKDFLAAHRFLHYMKSMEAKIQENPSDHQLWQEGKEALDEGNELALQWKIQKSPMEITRDSKQMVDIKKVYQLTQGQWSKVHTPMHGDTYFFQLIERKADETFPDQLIQANQKLLSDEARRDYFKTLLDQMLEKKALSIGVEELEPV